MLELAVCVVLPALALAYIFSVVSGNGESTDFESAFYPAAEAVLRGENPYPSVDDPIIERGVAYVYPPLTAIATVPFTILSVGAAGVLMMVLLAVAVAATLAVLGVRDWRCYGIAYAWPPVFSAIQTGNVTILLGLCAALAWRLRDGRWRSGASVGLALALKLFLWPLVVWFAATRRFAAAAASLVVALVLLAVSWAAIGFDGLREYQDLLDRLQDVLAPESYTVHALALDLGASEAAARAAWVALAVALLAGVVVLARRGDERRSFVVALAAALACTPLVWLHYFALLLVAVAVAQPRLGVVWFVPLVMYLSTATHNGTTAQTTLTIAAAVLTCVLALRPLSGEADMVVARGVAPLVDGR
jgi:hypothetical protein